MIEAKTIFYIRSINIIGGVEQWMYYIAKMFGKRKDFIVLYRDGDKKQLLRLAKHCRIQMYNDEKVKCDTAVFCYNFDIIDKIEAKEYYHFIHGNIAAVKKLYPQIDMISPPQITKRYSVSEITKDGYKEVYGIDTEVFYNILDIDKIKKTINNSGVLKLITASRLRDAIKGFDYMEEIVKELKTHGIPYQWLCFSDKPEKEIIGNYTFMRPNLDITPYIADADYLVQTSIDESYGYSIVESLMLDTPVIVMGIPVLKELGIKDGVHGYILNFDMSNLDVEKIYRDKPIIKNYIPPMDIDKWETILGKDIKDIYVYDEEETLKKINVRWIALARVKDDEGVKFDGEEVFIEDSTRLRLLLDHNLIIRKDKYEAKI